VIEALKAIAVNRKSTLIVTIHQPSAKLFGLFDKCLFLNAGKVTFTGPGAELGFYAANIYKTAGYGVPPQANAPEVFLELLDMLNTNNQTDLAVIDTFVSSEKAEILDYTGVNKDVFNTANSYPYESYLILRRNLTNILRTKELFVARIGAVTGFGKQL
jgi:ABC-type multidrug transport system ATPase subunit